MRIVIVGAGYAGVSCALGLSRRTRGSAQITLINAQEDFVERIRLHQWATPQPRRQLPLAELVRGTGIQLSVGWVRHIDLTAQTLQVGERVLPWDRLVLALGSEDDVDRIPGVRKFASTLSPGSVESLARALPALAERGERVVVVGGGLTGIEAASELAESYPGLQVALVTRGEVAADFSASARRYVRSSLARLGVAVHEHLTVERLEHDRLQTDSVALPFAACVWTSGFVAPTLPREAGLAVNRVGQVWVDAQLRALGHPHVFVAGDLAVLREQAGAAMPMGCKAALPTGSYVAQAVAGSLAQERAVRPFRYRAVPYCVSLGREDAILQMPVHSPDSRQGFLRGRLAARLKEAICRATLLRLQFERTRAVLAGLLRGRRAPALPSEQPGDRAHA